MTDVIASPTYLAELYIGMIIETSSLCIDIVALSYYDAKVAINSDMPKHFISKLPFTLFLSK